LTTSFWLMPKSDPWASATSQDRHRLDVELVGDDRRERLQRAGAAVTTVSSASGRRTRSFSALRSDEPDEHTARTVHRGDEVVVGRQRGGIRPVGEVHRATPGEPAPDLLGRRAAAAGPTTRVSTSSAV
jgi:hypothetical protein